MAKGPNTNNIQLDCIQTGDPQNGIPWVFQATVVVDDKFKVDGVLIFDPGGSTDGQEMTQMPDDADGTQIWQYATFEETDAGYWTATAVFELLNPTFLKSSSAQES